MKIKFENDFYDYILSRGYEYYLTDKVSDVVINSEVVTAIVHGTDDYKVMIELDDGIFVDGECNCPYFDNGEYCKHMAAVLYYLNKEGKYNSNNRNNYSLEDIVNKINEKKIKKFLYDNLMNDADLLNKFRVEFNNYFPKMSKKNYENKIYDTIRNCCDRYGFIDYSNSRNYEHAMLQYVYEAEKLFNESDYDTAFIIVSVILNSIPRTDIDDSNGSTGMIAESCIEIIHNIIDEINDDRLLKSILDYVIDEVKTLYLYNYGIDINHILEYFIDDSLYLDEIESALLSSLSKTKDKDYFYGREKFIKYLIQIYSLKNNSNSVMQLLEEYSFDESICIKYVDELIKNNEIDTAIKVLKSNLNDNNYRSMKYAVKLEEIYLNNNMADEYKSILYDILYKYSRYDFNTYLKIKKLYSKDKWKEEKEKIIDTIKKDSYSRNELNKIYIEEKMIDELFENVCNCHMDYIKKYEEYLVPKYNEKLLNIYSKLCLDDVGRANNRKAYKDVAISINHIIKMNNSRNIVETILNEINEKYFRSRPAMLDEFNKVIKNLNSYIQ